MACDDSEVLRLPGGVRLRRGENRGGVLLKRKNEGLQKAQPCRCGHQSAQRSKGKLFLSLLLSNKLNVVIP